MRSATLVLEDGSVFRGEGFGAAIGAATAMDVPLLTTLSAATAAVAAIRAVKQNELRFWSLQAHFER